MAKQHLSIYLDPGLMTALERFARERGRSRSVVAEAAIAGFLSPDDVERREAALIRRLDQQNRTAERLERDLGIAIEMQALFLRYWLTATPALPDAARAAAHAMGAQRFESFVASLGRRLASGARFTRELSFDVPPEPQPEPPTAGEPPL
jgi:predicted transcriptional regulator